MHSLRQVQEHMPYKRYQLDGRRKSNSKIKRKQQAKSVALPAIIVNLSGDNPID